MRRMVRVLGDGVSTDWKWGSMIPRVYRCLLLAAVCLLLAGCGSEVAYNTPPTDPTVTESAAPAEAPPLDPAAPAEEMPSAEEPAAEELAADEISPASEPPTDEAAEPSAPPTSEGDSSAPPEPSNSETTADQPADSPSAAPEQAERDFGALFNDMLSGSNTENNSAEDATSESAELPTTEPPKTEPPATEPSAPQTPDSTATSGEQQWKLPWENENTQTTPESETPAEGNPPAAEPAPPSEVSPAANRGVDVDELFGSEPTAPAESQPNVPPEMRDEEAAPEATGDAAPPAPPTETDPPASITVDPNNTRHLAWLFGAKFSLSVLANEKNSTPDQQVVWQTETAKLAGALGLAAPTATGSGPPAERVPQLLAESQKVGAELAAKHGAEAAALVELAVKSNLLLGLDENRRTFAPVIAKSLRSAAGRTSVPADVWEAPLAEIAAAKDNAAIEQAVYELHKRMEAALRLK
jgi:hypothetical protein